MVRAILSLYLVVFDRVRYEEATYIRTEAVLLEKIDQPVFIRESKTNRNR